MAAGMRFLYPAQNQLMMLMKTTCDTGADG
jgi:hypothetical protein